MEERDGEIVCRAEKLTGAEIYFALPSVGATENAMLAACAAEGTTIIYNAAREPEIEALQDYLRQLGAEVRGAGTPVITVSGFKPRERIGIRIMPDRIAAATLLCCRACAFGRCGAAQRMSRTARAGDARVMEMGCRLFIHKETLRIVSPGKLKARAPLSHALIRDSRRTPRRCSWRRASRLPARRYL